jgi:hypothetical protein
MSAIANRYEPLEALTSVPQHENGVIYRAASTTIPPPTVKMLAKAS